MRRVKKSEKNAGSPSEIELQDFSQYEENIAKIKYLKVIKQNMDKSFFAIAMDELGYKDKRISPKKLKRVCRKVLQNMIKEIK